jgi:hypothetical protein
MSGHILVVASGFGMRIIPISAPYRFSTEPGGSQLRIEVALAGKWRGTQVDPSRPPPLGPLIDVADVVTGPPWTSWWLEATPYRLPLPPGWTAVASGRIDPSPFDLVSSAGGLIYIQMPRSSPGPEQLLAAGQHLVRSWRDEVAEWVDLSYSHGGEEWYQRHSVRVGPDLGVVVTAQAQQQNFDDTMAAHAEVVRSIVPNVRSGGIPEPAG